MKKSKKIKFGLLGCGRIAQRHAQHISEFGELVATCDIVPEKAEALAKKYNASAVFNIDDLLNIPGIDVISVCTPNGLHAQHSIKTLKLRRNRQDAQTIRADFGNTMIFYLQSKTSGRHFQTMR